MGIEQIFQILKSNHPKLLTMQEIIEVSPCGYPAIRRSINSLIKRDEIIFVIDTKTKKHGKFITRYGIKED